MKKDYSQLEQLVIELLRRSETLKSKSTGKNMEVVFADKPTTESGEPKTDVYALFSSENGDSEELKLSLKKRNADFLENKTNAERAKEILGDNWETIIERATEKLADRFKNKYLVYFDKNGKTDAGSFTLGWKFEILNKKSGDLSDVINLTHDQKVDVYSGTNLPPEKRNAKVNGEVVRDSGVAKYILEMDKEELEDAQDIIDSMLLIDNYVEGIDLYFACKALNYRSLYIKDGKKGKYDGDRPLAVYIKWSVVDGKLTGDLVFDEPLKRGGKYAYQSLMNALKQMGANDINDLNPKDLNVKYFQEEKKND